MPDLLKAPATPSKADTDDLKLLLEKHGETIDIPVEALSKYDVEQLLRHLLYKDHMPEILRNRSENISPAPKKKTMTEEEQLREFNEILLSVDMETARLFMRYRELKQKALNLGLSDDNYDNYLRQLDMLEEMLKLESANYRSLANQYKNIAVLERHINLADDTGFTHMPYNNLDKNADHDIVIEHEDNDPPKHTINNNDAKDIHYIAPEIDIYDDLGH